MPDDLPIVDAHLDLAYNVLNGRDLRLSSMEIREQEKREEKSSMVTIPELSKGGVAVAFGSIFVSPKEFPETTDIEFDSDRAAEAKKEVGVYQSWEEEGFVRIIRSRQSLADHMKAWREDRMPGILIAMESAEPIESPDELGWWHENGVRMIGPAWGPTRYCGGFAGANGQATGYTPLGRNLMAGMKDLGIPLDLAHSSVECFWEALESDLPHVVYTHTTPREIHGRDRLPDGEMMKALAQRGGMLGLGLGNMFVNSTWWGEGAREPVKLDSVGRTFEIMAAAAGWDHVGIGSDLDGGIGVEESPEELDTIADIGKIAEALPQEARAGVMGGNWLRLLEEALPEN